MVQKYIAHEEMKIQSTSINAGHETCHVQQMSFETLPLISVISV